MRPGGAERATALGLALGRLAIGAGIWAAPGPSLRALGFDPGHAPSLALARLAGTRDLALGALGLAAVGDREALRGATLLNAAVDGGDALAFGLALARGHGIRRAALVGTMSGAAAALAGAALAARLGRSA